MNIIAIDTETDRIGPGNVIPKFICLSGFTPSLGVFLYGNHPDDHAENFLRNLLGTSARLVTHNGAFDWAVLMRAFPHLIPAIFNKLEQGNCTDTQYRELLLNLSTTGDLEKFPLPSGEYGRIMYGLADLETKYLGIDRSAEKDPDSAEESWRLNYAVLDGWRAEDYPEDARAYAMADAEGTYRVYMAQEDRKREPPHPVTNTEELRTFAAFGLYLMTGWGMKVNHKNVVFMRDKVGPIIEANKSLLIQHGILQEGTPVLPFAKQQIKALDVMCEHFHGSSVADVQREIAIKGWETFADVLALHKVKLKAAVPDRIKMEPLRARAEAIYKALGEIPTMTAGGADGSNPQISLAEDVPEYLAQYDEVFGQYAARQALINLRTHQIPLLESATTIHPNYGILKETGRTSSYGTRKGKVPLYPATNIQNVPAREIEGVDVRQCYEPRPGTVFFDVDGTTQELACVGQITYTLFGESVHLERYNAKVDLHGYLASQLIITIQPEGLPREFAQLCREEGILGDPMAVYEAFMECKHHEDEDVREKLFKHWRTFAKPTGLGFPGGLGPHTMVTYAKQTYDVDMTEKQAHEAREVWRQTYPEMVRFHKWINGQGDEYNSRGEDTRYQYSTPMGMLRRGASYCAAANGMSMQSPAAEGWLLAVCKIQRECYDRSMGSVLYGCRPIAFVHDQLIGETTTDRSIWHEQALRVAELVVEAMAIEMPDIQFRCDEAHLTSVWSKKSEPTFDAQKRLIPWAPKVT
jgi:3'-5' exonuclease